MLVKAIYCERMKCKGTLIWPAFLIIPVIPVLLGGGNYLSNLGLLTSEWYSLWTQVTLFYATFFFPPLIGTYCAFLWRYENFNGCRNTLFSAPVSYQTIYVSKFIQVCLMTLLTQMWFAVLFVAAGKAVGLMGLPLSISLPGLSAAWPAPSSLRRCSSFSPPRSKALPHRWPWERQGEWRVCWPPIRAPASSSPTPRCFWV